MGIQLWYSAPAQTKSKKSGLFGFHVLSHPDIYYSSRKKSFLCHNAWNPIVIKGLAQIRKCSKSILYSYTVWIGRDYSKIVTKVSHFSHHREVTSSAEFF